MQLNLKKLAKEEIDSCCTTMCNKKYVIEYIEMLEKQARKIEIIGKDNCSYCSRAVEFCVDNKLAFIYKKLDKDISLDEIKEQFPDARTFPIVSIDDTYIGGFKQLVESID